MPRIPPFCPRATAAIARHPSTACAAVLLLAALGALAIIGRSAARPDLPLSQLSGSAAQTQGASSFGGDSSAPASWISPVRVLLGTPSDSVRIEITGAYRIQPIGDARVLARGGRLGPAEVEPLPHGLRIGGERFLATRLEIVPESEPAVWVGDTQYRGRVRLLRLAGGRVAAVNVVAMEDYVASVVNSEMPADFPEAARQTQAIVARTYALYQMATFGTGSYFDVHASTRSQRYRGVQYREGGRRLAAETADSRRIAGATRGLVCTLGGRLFCTYYSAVCGGRTVQGSEVFADAGMLPSVPCNFCRDAPHYRWETEIARSTLEESLARYHARQGRDPGRLLAIEVLGSPQSSRGGTAGLSSSAARPPLGTVGQGGHAAHIRLRHQRGEFTLPATEFRTEVVGAERLRSAHFDVVLSAEVCRFHGRGWGHGVGLCQWGARGLALQGHDAATILRYYYPGMQLARVQ